MGWNDFSFSPAILIFYEMFSQFLHPIVIYLIRMFQKKGGLNRNYLSKMVSTHRAYNFLLHKKTQSFTTLFLKRIQYLHSTSLMKILLMPTINNSLGQKCTYMYKRCTVFQTISPWIKEFRYKTKYGEEKKKEGLYM